MHSEKYVKKKAENRKMSLKQKFTTKTNRDRVQENIGENCE